MAEGKSAIPLAPMDKLCRKAGAERVSTGAAKAMAYALEEIAAQIAVRAVKLAKHAGRKTIKTEDITLAKDEIWG